MIGARLPTDRARRARVGCIALLFATGAGCSTADAVTCGPGTVRDGDTCVAVEAGTDIAPSFGGVVAVAPVSATSLFVTWDDAQSPSTPPDRMRYTVFASASGTPIDFAMPLATTERGASSFALTHLDPKMYDVAVRAIDDAGRSDGNVVVKSFAPSADAAPPMFAGATGAVSGAAGSVTLHWAPAQDDLTPAAALVYYVYVASPDGTFDFARPLLVTRPGATSASLDRLYDGQRLYRFTVRARDAAENVDANEVSVSARAGADTTPPQFTGCKAAVVASAGSAVVSWDPATDDTTPSELIAYEIYGAKQEGSFDFTTPLVVATAGVNTTVTGLTANTTWHFVCRARDFSGNRDTNVIVRTATTPADSTPPTFVGLTGSDFDGKARTVRLSWAPGSDDKTTAEQLVYDVFEGDAPGGEDFQTPRASSTPGALSLLVSDLTPDTKLYWVVRARDQAGNHDANVLEASGTTNVSFSRQVQAIFSHDCAVSGCHVPGSPVAGLILAQGFTFDQLIDVPSTERSATKRVTPGDPAASYLWQKVSMNPPPVGWLMPAPATGSVLPPNELDLIRRWILDGAAQN